MKQSSEYLAQPDVRDQQCTDIDCSRAIGSPLRMAMSGLLLALLLALAGTGCKKETKQRQGTSPTANSPTANSPTANPTIKGPATTPPTNTTPATPGLPVPGAEAVAAVGASPPATSARPPAGCAPADIGTAFKNARKLDKNGRHKDALAAFQNLRKQCFDHMSASRKLWLLSDAALLQHKLGDDAGCLETLASFKPAWVAEAPRPAKAMRHNAGLCSEEEVEDACDYYTADSVACDLSLALELAPRHAYRGAQRQTCQLKLPREAGDTGPEDAIQIPGEPTRCLDIRSGRMDDDEAAEEEEPDEENQVCPRLVLFEKRAGKLEESDLDTPEETMLQRPSDCCHASVLETVVSAQGAFIILHSDGPNRDCFGGTASVDEYEVYRWRAGELELVADHSVSMH